MYLKKSMDLESIKKLLKRFLIWAQKIPPTWTRPPHYYYRRSSIFLVSSFLLFILLKAYFIICPSQDISILIGILIYSCFLLFIFGLYAFFQGSIFIDPKKSYYFVIFQAIAPLLGVALGLFILYSTNLAKSLNILLQMPCT